MSRSTVPEPRSGLPPLSPSAISVWGKTNRDDVTSMGLWQHLEDTAAVAGLLWDDWLSDLVKWRIAASLPGGLVDGRILLTWLAGVHDVGKASPAFAVQAERDFPHLASAMRAAGLDMPAVIADRTLIRHELAGHVALSRWLVEGYGFSKNVAETYATVVGSHHGAPPEVTALQRTVPANPHLLGGGRWVEVRSEFFDHLARLTGADQRLGDWAHNAVPYTAQVLLSASVIMADWIASDEEFFPYGDPSSSTDRAERAWHDLDLPRQWRPVSPPNDDEQLFAQRFAFPPGASPRPIQRAALAVAREVHDPGLLVIEAPMGTGKTEAALAAAEVLAHRTGAGGVFVALPTMATSDAMFSRVLTWVKHLPVGPGSVASEGDLGLDLSTFLAHGKAALNPEFGALRHPISPTGVAHDDDPVGPDEHRQHAAAVAHSWLSGRKRGPLSSIVVGTIDQVLFAALKSKHLALRHLALAGKVVIIDEVHAVDAFMGTFLQRALHWLGAYGVPTILLSATLPSSLRQSLVSAYETGRAVGQGVPAPRHGAWDALAGDIGYPVLVATTGETPRVTVTDDDGPPKRVHLERLSDDDAALVGALRDALAEGGCVGVVRNTVSRAQATYNLLLGALDAEVVLLHSRFLAVDRAHRERDLRARLGPPEAVRADGRVRPDRLVVVGTQVIEQSLDIDLDLLVTDLAPVDLVLQRMGRLHRHHRGEGQRDRPARLREPRCLLTGVKDWNATPPDIVGGSVRVYRRSPLLRSLVVLQESLDRGWLRLPEDIAPLVQAAYARDLTVPRGWQTQYDSAEQDRRQHAERQEEESQSFQLGPVKRAGASLAGWLRAPAGEAGDDSPRGQARVRDGEDGVEVVVVQRVGDQVRLLPWATRHAGQVIPTLGPPPSAIARDAALCTLKLPLQLTRPGVIDAVIKALERNWYPGWQDRTSSWLSGQLVLELDANLSALMGDQRLVYDRESGLVTTAERGT